MKSIHGLNDLPVDTEILTYGYGATPVKAIVLQRQTSDGRMLVGRKDDTGNVQRITPDDIVKVIQFPG